MGQKTQAEDAIFSTTGRSSSMIKLCSIVVLLLACLLRTNAFKLFTNRINIQAIYKCDTRRRRHSSISTTISMGLDVKIRMVGRKNGGEKWLESAYDTYEIRLKSSNVNVETQYHKNDDELMKSIEADESKNHKVVLLDPRGKLCTSEAFSDDMYRWLEEGGSRLSFVIGGAEGLPQEVKQQHKNGNLRDMLSLGMMTFTHQFARLLLMEQIYRASEIKKGSGYHK